MLFIQRNYLLQINCNSNIVKFNVGLYFLYMNLNKVRTTFRLERAMAGHSEAAKQLLAEVVIALKEDTPVPTKNSVHIDFLDFSGTGPLALPA